MFMKKVSLIVILLIAVMLIVGCSHNAEVSKKSDEDDLVSFSASNTENSNSEIVAKNESSTEVLSTETTTDQSTAKPKETEKSTTAKTTTVKPVDKKATGQGTTKKQTTTQKQTVTNKPTTTKKQSTTKEKTTASTTAKRNKLTKSDIDWVQSQAHAYIKSKGMSVNSNVSSFSYRTSSYNYTDKNKLLSKIKETIDFEYNECMDSGWNKVDMYVSVSADGDGDYWLVVMYG